MSSVQVSVDHGSAYGGVSCPGPVLKFTDQSRTSPVTRLPEWASHGGMANHIPFL